MINFLKSKRKLIFVMSLVLISLSAACVFAADPGSSSDPLISLSYFEDKIKSLQEEVLASLTKTFTENFDTLKKDITSEVEDIKKSGVSAPSAFEVITLAQGETIICEAGTEIIVRSGECIAIASSAGGISDVTEGKDLANGEKIAKNHLLIVPKTDGRGITATISGAVMVKGTFERKAI